ncbi:MAG: hypothetical protein BroJett024_38120 [Alphaproteobacteria bacterium]|nr:MAG: hypothetical protein BroJett024_38120 [Alphaproteobacteria bacterium]
MARSELLLEIIDEPDLFGGLKRVCAGFSVRHAVYHLAQNVKLQIDLPFIRTTYPAEWLGRYLIRNYYMIDPVVERGFGSAEPFLWSDLPRDTEERRAFFADAEAHGVGNCGYTVPIIDKSGRRAAFSVTDQDDPQRWAARIAAIDESLRELALVFHGKALAELYRGENVPSLSPREIQCLYWTTQGKDAGTISDILELSEHTVRDYLKSARLKLGCATIAQAVYEATRLRLINP